MSLSWLGANTLLSPLFVLTLHFCLIPLTSYTSTPTPALLIQSVLRWPSGNRKWHTCIHWFLCLCLFLSVCTEVRLRTSTFLWWCYENPIKLFSSFFARCLSQSWTVSSFSVVKSCYFSHRWSCWHVFVYVSTFPDPCPSNEHTGHQMHGKIAMNMNLIARSIRNNRGLPGQRGGRQKRKNIFLFTAI